MKRFLKEDEGGKSLLQMFVLCIHLLGLFRTVYQTDNKYGYDTFVLN